MHKSKDGKVYASLTEVKNKTGDIFAVVDEFGEISLTSYNKVRYKIVKVDINSVIDLVEKKVEKVKSIKINVVEQKKSKPEFEIKEEIKPHINVVEEAFNEVIQEDKNQKKDIAELSSASKVTELLMWDRNSKLEKDFTKKAISLLISN